MNDITFKSLTDLYNRLKPALTAKQHELVRNGLTYIKPLDVWNYLKETKWMQADDLSLANMVSDIFNADPIMIDDYVKQSLNKQIRVGVDQSGK